MKHVLSKLTTIAFIINIRYAHGLLCYSCQDVDHNDKCFNVTDCAAGEMCYGRADGLTTGNVVHTTGCTNKQTSPNRNDSTGVTYCNKLCNGDLCNLHECQLGAPRQTVRCLACDLVDQPDHCGNVVECNMDEMCYVEKFTPFNHTRYRLGCVKKEHCVSRQEVIPVGRRATHTDQCSVCCQGDHCNMYACGKQTSGQILQLKPLSQDAGCANLDSTLCSTFGRLNIDACKEPYVVKNCPKSCMSCDHVGWSPWFSWGVCSSTCGSGTRTRTRKCKHRFSFAEQQLCVGSSSETSGCSSDECLASLLVGDRVIRGPDWIWENQDGNGTGVVTGSSQGGWVTVFWNKTGQENSYRYGASGKYGVKLYPATTTVQPKTTVSVRRLNVGDQVIRGPDWSWGDQDGNTTGVVTGASVPGWVTVRWGYGSVNTYRYGTGGSYDVLPVNKGYTSGGPSGTASTSGVVSVGDVVVRGPDWTYSDQDGNGRGHVIQVDNQSNGTWVRIRWSNGYENFYRFDAEGKYEVIKQAIRTTPVTSAVMPTVNDYIFKVGDPVVRGPDWQWGNQDNGGQGTVTNVDHLGWVTVRWGNNVENSDRNGVQNAHDIHRISTTAPITTPHVTIVPPTAGARLTTAVYGGARVQRGIDWTYGSQDGNGPGTVRALPPNVPSGWVQVEWDNGYVNNYRLGKDNKYDIMFVPGTFNPPISG